MATAMFQFGGGSRDISDLRDEEDTQRPTDVESAGTCATNAGVKSQGIVE